MAISDEALALIKRWEGLRLRAYQDVGGVWTIGYGHTSAAGQPIVSPGMRITEQEAHEILIKDLELFEQEVDKNVKVPLNPNQRGALVSFVYNVGGGNFRKSTLLRKLNKGDYNSVPSELMKWNKVKGRTVQGLSNRRAAEAGLWARGSYVSSQSQPVSLPDRHIVKDAIAGATALGPLVTGASMSTGALSWALALGVVVVVILGGIYIYRNYL